MKILYVSDTRYYYDANKNWYVDLTFPINELSEKFYFIHEWHFFGRTYPVYDVSQLYMIKSFRSDHISIHGTTNQKKGLLGYLVHSIKAFKILKECIDKTDIIWLKFNFFYSYLTLFIRKKKQIVITHMVGDIDVLSSIKKDFIHKTIRGIEKFLYHKITRSSALEIYVSRALQAKYNKHNKTIVSHENRITKSFVDKTMTKSLDFNRSINYVYLGRIAEGKGIEDLLCAIKYLDYDLTLDIIGDGPLLSSVKTIISSINKRNISINILGRMKWGNDLFEHLKRYDYLVLPSYSEGLPLVLLEAMSCGLPCIATDVGGIPEIIEDNVNGYLYKPGDIDMLVSVMNKTNVDRDMYPCLSKNALDTAKINTLESQIEILYDEISSLVVSKI